MITLFFLLFLLLSSLNIPLKLRGDEMAGNEQTMENEIRRFKTNVVRSFLFFKERIKPFKLIITFFSPTFIKKHQDQGPDLVFWILFGFDAVSLA